MINRFKIRNNMNIERYVTYGDQLYVLQAHKNLHHAVQVIAQRVRTRLLR